MAPVGRAEIAEAKAYLQPQVAFNLDDFLASQTIETLFSSPLGPTPDCLSVDEIAAIVASPESRSIRTRAHAARCASCRADITLYQELRDDQQRDAAGGAALPGNAGPNAVTMLKSDHAKIKRLLRELVETTERAGTQRQLVVTQLEQELRIHTQAEEEVFYPAFHAAAKHTDSADLFFEAAEEHHIIDMVLPALKQANVKSKEFSAKAKVLKELIEHHINAEERVMLPEARKLFDEEQLRELGEMMQARKDALNAMWSNPLLRPVKKLQRAAQKLLPMGVKVGKAAKAQGREASRPKLRG